MFRFVLLVALLAHQAVADELVVGVEEIDYLPYYGIDEKGRYTGFAREMLDAAAEHTGHTFVYKPLPIQRLYKELLSQRIDFKFPDNENWSGIDRTGHIFYYSSPVIGYTDGILLKPGQHFEVDEFRQIGFVRGFAPWKLAEQIDTGTLEATELNSLSSLLKLLEKGRFQGAYFNVAVAQRLSHRATGGELTFAENLPFDKANYTLSTIKHPALLDELNRFLTSKQADEIRNKYKLVVH